ncbi:MAG: fumarate lyase [Spirochaetes bacterium]|nr:fumarate lyase [Spirochaetota bacterium]
MILYGTETAKALSNFGKGVLPRTLVSAYADVKKACLSSIQETENYFENEIFSAIIEALDEIRDGRHADQFVINLKQGGAGTSINMNINEVTASLAARLFFEKSGRTVFIDPIEDINRYQSTNDTFPSAVTIELLRKLNTAEECVIALQEILVRKETEFDNVIMTGRTEMQDALPMTAGHLFASWAGMIERDRWRINKIKERFRTVPLGGTAIGTSFGATRKYVFCAEKNIRMLTGLPLSRSQNFTDEISSCDKYSELANCMKIIAENIYKITGDLLFYTSSAVNEIDHNHMQYGSTIMPAKKNPVILEFARGLSIDIQHNCQKVSAYSANSQLQLNPYLPFIADAFEDIFESAIHMIDSLADKFFSDIKLNLPVIEKNFILSNAVINALLPVFGYNRLKEIYMIIEKIKPGTKNELLGILSVELKVSEEEIRDLFERSYLTSYMREK